MVRNKQAGVVGLGSSNSVVKLSELTNLKRPPIGKNISGSSHTNIGTAGSGSCNFYRVVKAPSAGSYGSSEARTPTNLVNTHLVNAANI